MVDLEFLQSRGIHKPYMSITVQIYIDVNIFKTKSFPLLINYSQIGILSLCNFNGILHQVLNTGSFFTENFHYKKFAIVYLKLLLMICYFIDYINLIKFCALKEFSYS